MKKFSVSIDRFLLQQFIKLGNGIIEQELSDEDEDGDEELPTIQINQIFQEDVLGLENDEMNDEMNDPFNEVSFNSLTTSCFFHDFSLMTIKFVN